ATHSRAPAVGQALDVLGLMARQAGPMPAGRIAAELGLARSTTYRLLDVLIRRGYVVHLPDQRRYGLGVAAFELGSAYSRQGSLQRVARPLLADVSTSCQQNSHLAVLHGADVLYLIEQRFPGRPSLVTDVGVRLPATLTASGIAMLAALPAAQVRAVFGSPDAFVQRHGLGPTSLSALRTVLTRTRMRGYAVEVDSVTPGLASVAVAVSDHTGYPIAAVTVTFAPLARDAIPANPTPPNVTPPDATPPSATSLDGIPESIVASVRQCAHVLSHRLGHR
ncbi:MAG: IclR family transcriptional regulator, partial [Ornithinimicrobium sp.]